MAFGVGSRVDGLYDGNQDDMWYPGRIQRVDATAQTYEVLYDDGEVESAVAPQYLRTHVAGTLCVGTRVFGRYAGGDEWYPGKVTEVQDTGCFTIEYDDTEVEMDVPLEFIKEPEDAVFEATAAAHDDGEDEQQQEEEEEDQEESNGDAPAQASSGIETSELHGDGSDDDSRGDDLTDNTTADDDTERPRTEPLEETEASLPRADSVEDNDEAAAGQDTRGVHEQDAALSSSPPPRQQAPASAPQPFDMERPRFLAKPKPRDDAQQPQLAASTATSSFETDEYASIIESIKLLEKRLADAASIKAVLSTLVKQMRAFPQVTADLMHERSGERLVIAVLTFHDAHAVIQCYCFVLLRRLCFLCGKSTHYFLRNGILALVTAAMRRFADDAILQASACGALAVFTRVHAGLNLLLEHSVAQLVLATIVYHKAYSIHTRQVHYYACEGALAESISVSSHTQRCSSRQD